MVPVILAGGAGSRLWPLSRSSHPKQFLPLIGNKTMLQTTVERLEGIDGGGLPTVICNEQHRFLVAEQLRELGIEEGGIILEPFGRNTAPAIAIAAMAAREKDPDELLIVLPADHLLVDTAAFRKAVAQAATAAEEGALATFGIVPTRPETGYGYIRAVEGGRVSQVSRFVEKPDALTAEEYLDSGDYYWNGGMFLFRADRILQELELWAPEVVRACSEAYQSGTRDLVFTRLDPAAFTTCPNVSIDYAVMEHTDSAVVVPLEAGWSDIGCWSALCDAEERDGHGNVIKGDALTVDTTGSYIRAEDRLVATIGLKDCIVIETTDAVLVADKHRSQEVKLIVEQLKAAGREECDFHRRVHRPWGFYEGVSRADRFQVKKIIVNPGAALSLQMHHHRAEHWIVVRGTARVICNEETHLISEDQSTYIPLGTLHRLENPGKIPLELIEVQTGSYLGEDDIVRFQDDYRRMSETGDRA
ncbi:mannose-1-phosphate guanylyltransferase/mannose-6-phosphate isomerase [Thiohalomonas denitrificans]|uniref:mannose-1-phosphate guanylyltransferase/mannose-6-phosphate isomerase n=1 Tax=Thiohalomonas denitrificans TaxID=415747 RepID=UPI0026EDAC3F|nr:mannose-1-phosphate guanylyltransferase/mannose-6-phosphate isomerase [Thiohalomonas denitrificans]